MLISESLNKVYKENRFDILQGKINKEINISMVAQKNLSHLYNIESKENN